MNKNLLY